MSRMGRSLGVIDRYISRRVVAANRCRRSYTLFEIYVETPAHDDGCRGDEYLVEARSRLA